MSRQGLTLIEALVSLAIVGVLVGLLLSAVQSARRAAEMSADKNNVRQIMLGFHNYASQYGGRLPGRKVRPVVSRYPLTSHAPLFNIIPYVEGRLPYHAPGRGINYPNVQTFLSATDPTYGTNPLEWPNPGAVNGPTSYVVNDLVFGGAPTLPTAVPDGTTETIAVAQHYTVTTAVRPDQISRCDTTYCYVINPPRGPLAEPPPVRCGTFADGMYSDAMPVALPGRPTVCSIPGATFQPRPTLDASDYRMLQSTSPAGLVAGMFDGSVRVYSTGVSETVFWSAVSPAAADSGGGE
jgi:prepilin-type N-terminal cleavage/methylation domain-containing protein